jgi:5-methylcytosine-specific restriction endonuclease McrA
LPNCPRCNYNNAVEGTFCNKCGWRIYQPYNPASDPAPLIETERKDVTSDSAILVETNRKNTNSSPGIIQCPRCNWKNAKAGRFCNKCGLDLNQDSVHAATATPASLNTEPSEKGGFFSVFLNAIRGWWSKRQHRLATERQQQQHRWAVQKQQQQYWQWYDSLYAGGSRNSEEWKYLRQYVQKRDHYRCVKCGRNGRSSHGGYGRPYVGLVVHHIKPLNHGGTNEISNLQTLCKECHEQAHGRQMKGKYN